MIHTYSRCEKCGGTDGLLFDHQTRSVGKCPDCAAARAEVNFQNNCFRSMAGTVIDFPLMESLAHRGRISPEIFELSKEPPKSRLIIGSSGCGKTLLSKKIYNDLLRLYDGYSGKIFYVKEYELFKTFRDQNHTDEFFYRLDRQKPEWILIDEAFHEINWRDKDADRDYARLAHLTYYQMVDWYLYEPRWKKNASVIMTANNEPERVIGTGTENQRALVRRVRVVTATKRNET